MVLEIFMHNRKTKLLEDFALSGLIWGFSFTIHLRTQFCVCYSQCMKHAGIRRNGPCLFEYTTSSRKCSPLRKLLAISGKLAKVTGQTWVGAREQNLVHARVIGWVFWVFVNLQVVLKWSPHFRKLKMATKQCWILLCRWNPRNFSWKSVDFSQKSVDFSCKSAWTFVIQMKSMDFQPKIYRFQLEIHKWTRFYEIHSISQNLAEINSIWLWISVLIWFQWNL